MRRSTAFAVVSFIAIGLAEPASTATDRISGLITRPYEIVEDTELAGDVTCDVTGAPCFLFAVSGVELRLNGFSITGKADPVTGCGGAATNGEAGVHTNNQPNVSIRGPGLIQRFRFHGVQIASPNARVEGITASTNCAAGIFVGTPAVGALVQGNLAVRNGSTMAGFSCGGI
jgi:hypothetical protein